MWNRPIQLKHNVPRVRNAADARVRHRGLHPCQALRSFYEVLEVETDASEEDIRSAFRQKARVMHPDVNKAPDAGNQFMELKRAYDVLSEPMLRAEHDAQLGLPSARANDPRFARFERWRREVVPDLRMQLEVWTNEIDMLIEEIGQQCSRTVMAADLKLGQLNDSVLAKRYRLSSDDTRSTEEQSDAISKMMLDLKENVAAIQTYAGDVTAQVQRLYDKRYDQVSTRYPAYPDLVWYDIWEEVSDEWVRKAQQRSSDWILTAQEYNARISAVEAALSQG